MVEYAVSSMFPKDSPCRSNIIRFGNRYLVFSFLVAVEEKKRAIVLVDAVFAFVFVFVVVLVLAQPPPRLWPAAAANRNR